MYNKMEKILTGVLRLITIAVLVLVLLLARESYKNETQINTFFLDHKIVLHRGKQMEPTIKDKSLVLVEKFSFSDPLEKGELYFYEFKERSMIARYQEKTEKFTNSFLFKADGELKQYPAPVQREYIFGKVKYHIPLEVFAAILLGIFAFVRLLLFVLYKKDAQKQIEQTQEGGVVQ